LHLISFHVLQQFDSLFSLNRFHWIPRIVIITFNSLHPLKRFHPINFTPLHLLQLTPLIQFHSIITYFHFPFLLCRLLAECWQSSFPVESLSSPRSHGWSTPTPRSSTGKKTILCHRCTYDCSVIVACREK
jgi:hypothetical protein